jgi:hypothetical protein
MYTDEGTINVFLKQTNKFGVEAKKKRNHLVLED